MRRLTRASLMTLVGLLTVLLVPSGETQQLPPGVKVQVLGEMGSKIPGVEKIVMKRFTLDPGAKLENLTPTNTQLCTASGGEATVTMGGKTIVRKAGQAWVEEKGVTFSIENKGKRPFVDLFFELIEKKA